MTNYYINSLSSLNLIKGYLRIDFLSSKLYEFAPDEYDWIKDILASAPHLSKAVNINPGDVIWIFPSRKLPTHKQVFETESGEKELISITVDISSELTAIECN
ncbi:hypothetical protein [Okeania sp. SIO1I7]|uniref:hypothetical protein n=1 Tax=Okeania sp. SIO1I7 TaxID=2607772 RepID=UPI0013FB0D4E|nr:hypothetical protein [Okeania sp. SIO1I7]NET29505.1 hypothetical protein [Okeania sp. SIO1I7]